MKLVGSCHCGAVRVEAARRPRQLTDCNCSVCRRYGALWAYYSPKNVRVLARRGATRAYAWRRRGLAFHHCTRCGCLTHYTTRDGGPPLVALNARMLAPEDLLTLRVRRLDRAHGRRVLERSPFASVVPWPSEAARGPRPTA